MLENLPAGPLLEQKSKRKLKRPTLNTDSSSFENAEENPPLGPLSKSKSPAYKSTWTKTDLKEADGKEKCLHPKPTMQLSPTSLFELFFTSAVMDHICKD